MNKPKRKIRLLAGSAAAAVLLAASPGLAAAQTDGDQPSDVRPSDRAHDRPLRDHSFEEVQERLLAAIEKRLEALDRMSGVVEDNQHVAANHAAHLQKDYKDAEKILEDAAEDVEEAETFSELREAIEGVFGETLVFALLRPKTHLVLASDTSGAIADRMTTFADRLREIIERLEEAGHDMSAAIAAVDAAEGHIEGAEALAGPVADSVIDLDHKDWPEPAQSQLQAGRADLVAARDLFRQARDDLRTAVGEIRAALSRD